MVCVFCFGSNSTSTILSISLRPILGCVVVLVLVVVCLISIALLFLFYLSCTTSFER